MNAKPLGLGVVALLLASGILISIASAAEYPARPIRVVIPWPPGGSTDIVGRILAADLTARFKQQVLIDNRAGAASIVGLQFATAQPPDGYTLMMTSTAYGFLIDKPKVPVDLVNSFAPVALIGFGESAIIVHPSLPVKTVKDLIDLARKRPGEILYSSSGIGGFPHMNTELFTLKTGAKMVHVPFKGGGPAIMDVVAGHSQLNFGSLVTVLPHVNSGRVRLVATGGAKRNPKHPNVPAIAETVPGYEMSTWYGAVVPVKTPREIVQRLNQELLKALALPDVKEKLAGLGADVVGSSIEETVNIFKVDVAKFTKVAHAAKITAD